MIQEQAARHEPAVLSAHALHETHEVGIQLPVGHETVAEVRVQDLRSLQFSNHKSESILAVAEALANGKISLEELDEMSDPDAMKTLTDLRGIGPWSAEWILVRCLGRSRVVAGDLGVKKAVTVAYLGKDTAQEEEVRRTVAHWGVHATVAQAILLHAYALKAL